MKSFVPILMVLSALGAHAEGNLILDGDLEAHTIIPNAFNVREKVFNTSFRHVHSFGEFCGVDVVGVGRGEPAKSGKTKLCLAWNGVEAGDRDGVALELRSQIAKGETCRLSFWVERLPFGDQPQPIEVGLSARPDRFGVRIFEARPDEGWTRFQHVFAAPVSGQYLTVRPKGKVDAWFAIDAFVLRHLPEGGGPVAGGPGLPALAGAR